MMESVREQLIEQLNQLTPGQQAQLLMVARQLHQSSLPPGTPGEVLLAARHKFHFEPGDVDEMMAIIEEGTTNIDWEQWR